LQKEQLYPQKAYFKHYHKLDKLKTRYFGSMLMCNM